LSNSSVPEVAALSKFALAQVNESDGKLDDAARMYSELAKLNGPTSARKRPICVSRKSTRSRERRRKPLIFCSTSSTLLERPKTRTTSRPQISAAAREAADELKKLDPDRYAQLPPEATPSFLG
jgi:hypothetical protein